MPSRCFSCGRSVSTCKVDVVAQSLFKYLTRHICLVYDDWENSNKSSFIQTSCFFPFLTHFTETFSLLLIGVLAPVCVLVCDVMMRCLRIHFYWTWLLVRMKCLWPAGLVKCVWPTKQNLCMSLFLVIFYFFSPFVTNLPEGVALICSGS